LGRIDESPSLFLSFQAVGALQLRGYVTTDALNVTAHAKKSSTRHFSPINPPQSCRINQAAKNPMDISREMICTFPSLQ
jgi:hypothetical protein